MDSWHVIPYKIKIGTLIISSRFKFPCCGSVVLCPKSSVAAMRVSQEVFGRSAIQNCNSPIWPDPNAEFRHVKTAEIPKCSDLFRFCSDFLHNGSLNPIPTRQNTKNWRFPILCWQKLVRNYKISKVAPSCGKVASSCAKVAPSCASFFPDKWHFFGHVAIPTCRIVNLYDLFSEFHSDCPIFRLSIPNSPKARPVKAKASARARLSQVLR